MRLSSATLRGFLGPTNPPIHQPAAGGTTQKCVDAGATIETASDATVVAEVEFREIAMQMWLATVLIDAEHAALEEAEGALDRVGVQIAAGVLTASMVDRLVRGEALAGLSVETAFVREQRRLRIGVGIKDLADPGLGSCLDVKAADCD